MTSDMLDPLDALAKQIHETAKDKGFWDGECGMDKYAAKLALVHSEVTEVLEALRKSQGTRAVTDEFADVIIRLLDLYHVLSNEGYADPYLTTVLHNKMNKNRDRPRKHGHSWG